MKYYYSPAERLIFAVKNSSLKCYIISSVMGARRQIVVFDLETSGLYPHTDEIVQIAAKYQNMVFSQYILPKRGISAGSSAVNKLTVENGVLLWKGKEVRSTPLEVAVKDFISFLKKANTRVILVAHNGFRFDGPFLRNAVLGLGMANEFTSVVDGFADTLPLVRARLPGMGMGSYKQENLARLYKIQCHDAHNAVNDVEVLIQLIEKIGITTEEIIRAKQPTF